MSKKRQKQETVRFNLNVPPNLLKKIEQIAKRNNRSTTGQIISALEWCARDEVIVESATPAK